MFGWYVEMGEVEKWNTRRLSYLDDLVISFNEYLLIIDNGCVTKQ